jgi:hypothetical protein
MHIPSSPLSSSFTMHTLNVPWFLSEPQVDDSELLCVQVLLQLRKDKTYTSLQKASVKRLHDEDGVWEDRVQKKPKKERKLKFQRTLNACSEHRRKHQRWYTFFIHINYD